MTETERALLLLVANLAKEREQKDDGTAAGKIDRPMEAVRQGKLNPY